MGHAPTKYFSSVPFVRVVDVVGRSGAFLPDQIPIASQRKAVLKRGEQKSSVIYFG